MDIEAEEVRGRSLGGSMDNGGKGLFNSLFLPISCELCIHIFSVP